MDLVIKGVGIVAIVALLLIMVINAIRGSHTRRLYMPGTTGGVAPLSPAPTPPPAPTPTPAPATPAAVAAAAAAAAAAKKKMPWWLKVILTVLVVSFIAAASIAIFHFVVVGGRMPTITWPTGFTLSVLDVVKIVSFIFVTLCFIVMVYALFNSKWGQAGAMFMLMWLGPLLYLSLVEKYLPTSVVTSPTIPPTSLTRGPTAAGCEVFHNNKVLRQGEILRPARSDCAFGFNTLQGKFRFHYTDGSTEDIWPAKVSTNYLQKKIRMIEGIEANNLIDIIFCEPGRWKTNTLTCL